MKNRYFIMMYSQSGETAFPMATEEEHVAFFSTVEEARDAANEHFIASNFGYEVFCLGNGE